MRGGFWISFGRGPEIRLGHVPEGRGSRHPVEVSRLAGSRRVRRRHVKTASGDVSLDEALEDTRVKTASGDVHVERAGGVLSVNSASGDLHVGTVSGPLGPLPSQAPCGASHRTHPTPRCPRPGRR